MAATTSIRWELTLHLLELLRGHENAAGVQIEPGYPGAAQADESIYLLDIVGDLDIPVFKAGRMMRDDKFEMTWQIWVRGKTSRDEAVARTAELLAVFEDTLADDPHVEDLKNAIVAAEVSSVEGPRGADFGAAGFMGNAEVTLSIHSRLE